MALTEAEAKLIADHEKAQTHSMKWIQRINQQFFARGQILTHAMDQFNEFLRLPKSDSRASAIWDLAFAILSTAVPALRLVKFTENLRAAANVSMAMAKLTAKSAKAAKVVHHATGVALKTGKAVNFVNDAKEKIGKAKDAVEVLHKDDSDEGPLASFDTTRKPVLQLVKDYNEVAKSWETAIDSEQLEFENKLFGKSESKETQEAMVKRLLILPENLTASELAEIENLYLWHMIAEHARKNVKIEYNQYRLKEPLKVEHSYNDNQIETILSLFGPSATRGKIFYLPMIFSEDQFFFTVGVPQTVFQPNWNYTPYKGIKGRNAS